jgi:hypothetical protein
MTQKDQYDKWKNMIADFQQKVQEEVERKLLQKKEELFPLDHPIADINVLRISVIAGVVAEKILKEAFPLSAVSRALLTAKDTIKAFHGDEAWDLYETYSSEMKAINNALEKVTKRSELSKPPRPP